MRAATRCHHRIDPGSTARRKPGGHQHESHSGCSAVFGGGSRVPPRERCILVQRQVWPRSVVIVVKEEVMREDLRRIGAIIYAEYTVNNAENNRHNLRMNYVE